MRCAKIALAQEKKQFRLAYCLKSPRFLGGDKV